MSEDIFTGADSAFPITQKRGMDGKWVISSGGVVTEIIETDTMAGGPYPVLDQCAGAKPPCEPPIGQDLAVQSAIKAMRDEPHGNRFGAAQWLGEGDA